MSHRIDLDSVIAGSLSKTCRAGGEYHHLTWKKNGKTITRYIRLAEADRIRKGINAYKLAKRSLDRAAERNLKMILKKRR